MALPPYLDTKQTSHSTEFAIFGVSVRFSVFLTWEICGILFDALERISGTMLGGCTLRTGPELLEEPHSLIALVHGCKSYL